MKHSVTKTVIIVYFYGRIHSDLNVLNNNISPKIRMLPVLIKLHRVFIQLQMGLENTLIFELDNL